MLDVIWMLHKSKVEEVFSCEFLCGIIQQGSMIT
jgi:hypothetical protein